MTESLHLYGRFVSNQGLQNEIDQLENQMKTLQPGSPEYEYDQLELTREQRELEIRQENPNLDPTTQAGEQALAQLMKDDPTLQAIQSQITTLINTYPSESTTWGIPMADSQYVTTVEIN